MCTVCKTKYAKNYTSPCIFCILFRCQKSSTLLCVLSSWYSVSRKMPRPRSPRPPHLHSSQSSFALSPGQKAWWPWWVLRRRAMPPRGREGDPYRSRLHRCCCCRRRCRGGSLAEGVCRALPHLRPRTWTLGAIRTASANPARGIKGGGGDSGEGAKPSPCLPPSIEHAV